METKKILKDIAKRCDDDISFSSSRTCKNREVYVYKKEHVKAVIPYIDDPDAKLHAIDELPQSGKGKMIMTVEPKFIPNQAVSILLEDNLNAKVRLVDSVRF
ncbi:stage IV sporulation protein A [Tannockella kyphosi]|uniref:stage IV sporulation protein A n=1 Tax=Tannockella kyphosi TaxID=2899121 RepID=UPI0020111668|nr:stage IV sporulation protein A [Tannockella kyphosi]